MAQDLLLAARRAVHAAHNPGHAVGEAGRASREEVSARVERRRTAGNPSTRRRKRGARPAQFKGEVAPYRPRLALYGGGLALNQGGHVLFGGTVALFGAGAALFGGAAVLLRAGVALFRGPVA